MSTEDKLFIHKYQPLYFNDFGSDNSVVDMLKTLILLDILLKSMKKMSYILIVLKNKELIIIEQTLKHFAKLVPTLKTKKK